MCQTVEQRVGQAHYESTKICHKRGHRGREHAATLNEYKILGSYLFWFEELRNLETWSQSQGSDLGKYWKREDPDA